MRPAIIIALSILLGGAANAIAQTNYDDHSQMMDHGTHMQNDGSGVLPLTEPGQSAFAALSEIVMVLEVDPHTDWSKVDLGAVRDHLVDMDRLIMRAVADETELPGGLRIIARGDGDTLATLRRMVPAHSAQLAKDDRWTVAVAENDASVEMTVTSDDPAVIARIKGLGFFGLMASQDHHREHHMMMARGEDAHRH